MAEMLTKLVVDEASISNGNNETPLNNPLINHHIDQVSSKNGLSNSVSNRISLPDTFVATWIPK